MSHLSKSSEVKYFYFDFGVRTIIGLLTTGLLTTDLLTSGILTTGLLTTGLFDNWSRHLSTGPLSAGS